jgi:hypothetical protein
MASFTDSIMQSRPYVQQLPLEAMAQVGMYKQQKYEEGVQKIQSYIDNVAGLDVARGVDKQYLQSKLNDLGSKLKTVAAGDFSNFQLVNSVGGMATQIVKDPNVQNAVQSTAWYRNQLSKIQKDIDEGKSSPDNIDHFNKKAQTWLNSSKAGEKFNASYTPFFDVFKFTKETFDAIQPDGYSFDQVYVTNSDGTIKTDSNGKPVYSPVMVRLEKEGKFPEKVKQTIEQIFSDSRVGQQLSISGEYNLRGYAPEQLALRAEQTKQSLLEGLNDKLADLILEKNTGKDVQDKIDQINLQIENTTNKYDQYRKLAIDNPDAVRGAMYKDDVAARYTTMFTNVKTKTQSLSNPGWESNFKLMEEANQNRRFREEMEFKYDKERWDRGYKMLELEMKGQKKFGIGETGTIQDFQATDPAVYVAQFEQSYANAADRYSGAADNMIFSLALNTPKNQDQLAKLVNGGMSREQAMNTMIANAAKLNNENPDEFRNRWLQRSVEKINQMDPTKLQQDPMLQGVYNTFSAARQDFTNLNNTKKQIESRLDKNLLKTLDAADMGKKLNNVQITVEGKPVTVTGEDLWNAALYAKGNQSSIGFLNSPALREQAKVAEAKLRQAGKGFLLDFALERAIVPEGVPPLTTAIRGIKGIARTMFGDTITNQGGLVVQLNNVYKSLDDKVLMGAAEAKANALKSSGFSVSPNLRMDILTGDGETDRALVNFIGNTAGNYGTNKQNLSADFNGETINTILADKNNFKPFELKTSRNDATGEVFPEIVFYNSAGERAAGMSITGEEAGKLGVNINTLYESPAVRNVRTRINASPIRSTSFGDPRDVSTYMQGDVLFEKNNMPKLAGLPYDVKANVQEVDGMNYGIIYVNDGRSKPKVRVLPPTQDVGEAIIKLQSTSPQLITAILNEK